MYFSPVNNGVNVWVFPTNLNWWVYRIETPSTVSFFAKLQQKPVPKESRNYCTTPWFSYIWDEHLSWPDDKLSPKSWNFLFAKVGPTCSFWKKNWNMEISNMKGLVSAFQCQTSDFNLIIWRFQFPIEKIAPVSHQHFLVELVWSTVYAGDSQVSKKNRPKQVESIRLDQKQVDN